MTVEEFLRLHPDARDGSGRLIRELHGVSLKEIVERLSQAYGWAELARLIPINCFAISPSVPSSLTFLRRTPWARAKVERLYVAMRTAEIFDVPKLELSETGE